MQHPNITNTLKHASDVLKHVVKMLAAIRNKLKHAIIMLTTLFTSYKQSY